MDVIITKVLITGMHPMALELTGSLVPKHPRFGSHRLVVVAVGLLQGHIGEDSSMPLRSEPCAGDTTVSDQYVKTERGEAIAVSVKQWVE